MVQATTDAGASHLSASGGRSWRARTRLGHNSTSGAGCLEARARTHGTLSLHGVARALVGGPLSTSEGAYKLDVACKRSLEQHFAGAPRSGCSRRDCVSGLPPGSPPSGKTLAAVD